jgi:hypothetical protein
VLIIITANDRDVVVDRRRCRGREGRRGVSGTTSTSQRLLVLLGTSKEDKMQIEEGSSIINE